MAPAAVLGNHPQKNPCTPRFSLCDAAGMGCGSIECVTLLEAAPAVVLPLPLGCLVYVVFSDGGTRGIHFRYLPPFPWPYRIK